MVLKKSTLILSAIALALASSLAFGQKYVPPHTTKKGKYVPGHFTKARVKSPKVRIAKPKTVRAKPAKSKAGLSVRSTSDPRFSVGDKVTSVKDSHGVSYPIRNQEDLDRFLKSHSGPETVTVHVTRDGKSHSYKVNDFRAAFNL